VLEGQLKPQNVVVLHSRVVLERVMKVLYSSVMSFAVMLTKQLVYINFVVMMIWEFEMVVFAGSWEI
jgi:hypothetical protein